MKALFIGAGSIGKRHIRDFYNECRRNEVTPEIDVLRRAVGDLGDLEPMITKQITEIQDYDYDGVFITNPTNLHFDALKKCKGRTKYYFIEKPIFESMRQITDDLDIDDSNTYVAAPMRHTTLFRKLKETVASHRVFSVRVICSSYLPDWRKDVDYREVYSARKEMGGGVNIDLIHEIDYIYDLFGSPDEVYAVSGKYSDLEITSNDLSVFILKYKNTVCEIHLDYFGRQSRRTCELYTHEGTYIADFINEVMVLPDETTLNCHVMPNEEFINEMHYFYEFMMGKQTSINPPSLALKTLDISLRGDTL